MRLAFAFFFGLLASPVISQNSADPYIEIDRFLKTYVTQGKVDYKAIAENPEMLEAVVASISALDRENIDPYAEKAILVNAYNIFVIQQVVDHYPISSPQAVPDFFTEKKFKFAGNIWSLNGLEKEFLLKKHPDPRLHFALVCAARGCPEIRAEAYIPEEIEDQLNEQAALVINSPNHVQYEAVSNTLSLSRIFEWYASDFGQGKAGLLKFLNQYSEEIIPASVALKYLDYDWSLNESLALRPEANKSNLQLFTPSALFRKGEFEVNAFNSIYSQMYIRDDMGELVSLGQTQNFFTSMIMFTTGVSKKTRFNVGLDLFISKARTVEGEASSLDVFNSSEAVFNRTLVSYISPRIKFVPLKSVPRLSVQSALWIPVSNELESEGFVAHNRYTWFTQVFFDQSIGEHFQLFLEASLLYRFARTTAQQYDFFRTPFSVFMSYFPSSKSTIFVFSQYSPRFETVNTMGFEEFGLTQSFTQIGIGGKYQITQALGIELSYSNFAFSMSEGAGHTLNFGLRYIYR